MGFLKPDATLDQFPPAPRTVVWRPEVAGIRVSIGAVAIFLLLYGGIALLSRHYRFVELCRKGVRVDAHVVSKKASTGKYTTFTLNYEVTVPEGVVMGKKTVDANTWDIATVGDPVPITYDPLDIQNNGPRMFSEADASESFTGLVMWGFAYGLTLIVTVAFFEEAFRSERKLAQQALVATATVRRQEEDVSGRYGTHKEYWFVGQFTDDEGQAQGLKTIRMSTLPRELSGDSVETVVFYEPNNRWSTKLWPLFKYVDISASSDT